MKRLKRCPNIITLTVIAACFIVVVMFFRPWDRPSAADLLPIKLHTGSIDGLPDTSPTSVWRGSQAGLPFQTGEKTVYKISFCGLPFGESTAEFGGVSQINNQMVYLINFTTKTLEFRDSEKVYVDKTTFLPIQVHRHIKKGRTSEEITEYYDRQNGFINLLKVVNGKRSLQKKACAKNVQNSISLFYYCRANNFKIGDSFSISLPHRDYTLKLDSIERIKTKLGRFEAYLFKTDPDGVKFWISTQGPKLLLKAQTILPVGVLDMDISAASGIN